MGPAAHCIGRGGLVLAILAGQIAGASAGPGLCLDAAGARAERVRIVQTELMVAALQCRGRADLGLTAKYNRLVRRHGPALIAQSKILEARFRSHFGADFRRQLNARVTDIANGASLAALGRADFCAEAARVADSLLAVSGEQAVALLSQPMLAPPATDNCPRVAGERASVPVTEPVD